MQALAYRCCLHKLVSKQM